MANDSLNFYLNLKKITEAAAVLADQCHGAALARGWWHDLETGERKDRNVGELLCLIHSEISEAMEGHRNSKMDDHLPHRPSFEVELADAVIRIFDVAEGLRYDLPAALAEKMSYNAMRKDHDIESRRAADGKKY